MHAAEERFALFVAQEKARNTKRLRFALLMAALIGLLLWRTQWLALRPGLSILLAGQFGAGLILLVHNAAISKFDVTPILAWFDSEKRFAGRLALFENSLRIAGFAVLAYNFWLATQNIVISIMIGLIYPATAYFGMGRRTYLSSLRKLEEEKEAVAGLLTARETPEIG